MEKLYVDTEGVDFIVDTNVDLSGASTTDIEILKPDGTTDTWTGAIEDTKKIKYTLAAGDIDVAGKYKGQSSVDRSGYVGRGATFVFEVFANFN
jgi:hypothetical protein